MPLLDIAQRQVGEDGAKQSPPYGGWIPRAAMDTIADMLDMHAVKVHEVATFYSMYNLAPWARIWCRFARPRLAISVGRTMW